LQFKCVEGCSDCCIYREYYPEKRYGKVGVLLMPSEKERVEQLARNLGLKIAILPRIGIGSVYSDGRKLGPKRVIAYQLMGINDDGNLCPFLDVNGKEQRPLACRAYPVIDIDNIKLDAKCQFCKSCSGKVENVQHEIEALAKIQQAMHFDEKDVWRYATGVGNMEDVDVVQKGWILDE
jgi:hypothetical protein